MKFESWLAFGWKLEQMKALALDAFRGIHFVVDLIKTTCFNLHSAEECRDPLFIRNKMIKMNICNGFLDGFKQKVLMQIVDKMDDCETESKNENDDELEVQKPYALVTKAIEQKLIKKEFEFIMFCSLLIKEWISTYYPSPVIDQNICNVLA